SGVRHLLRQRVALVATLDRLYVGVVLIDRECECRGHRRRIVGVVYDHMCQQQCDQRIGYAAGLRRLRRRAKPDRAFEIRLLAGATEPEIRAPFALRVSRPAAIDYRLLRVSTGTAAKVTACPGWPCVHPKSAASG